MSEVARFDSDVLVGLLGIETKEVSVVELV